MNPIAEFRQYWNRLNSTVMSGDKLVTPPWRYDFENIDIFKENPLRRNVALREIFYAVAWLSVFLGLIVPSFRILIVTGLSSLVYSHLLYRTVWKQMNAVTVKDVEYPQHVEVGAEFVVKVKVHNSGKSIAKVIAIHLHFSGSSDPNQIGMIHNLRGSETRDMEFRFRADQNMGPHYLGPIHTTIADYLGAHELTVRKNLQAPVILRPPILPVAFLETKRANYGMMPGVLDIPVSGSSPSFLGLRPWRDGDSIRQIDWKRSMRSQHIVVKEFERQSSTDVTLLLDTYQVAHSAFAKESSIEMAKTISISVANTLLQRQMRVQALIGDVWLPLGVGNHQLDSIYKYTVEAKLGRDPIHATLKEHIEEIPSASMAVLVVTDVSLMRGEFLEMLMRMKEREVEIVCVMIEALEFASRVRDEAQLKPFVSQIVDFVLSLDPKGTQNLESAVKLCDIVIPMRAGDDIAQKFREVA